MTITLFVNTAENNRLDKTNFLRQVAVVEGTLRESTSVLSPTILLELPNLIESALVDEDDEEVDSPDDDLIIREQTMFSFNYAYIEELKRYYFVQDINIVRSHLFSVTMIADVLMSFKANILSLDAFVERNEYRFDDYLEDPLRPLNYRKNQTSATLQPYDYDMDDLDDPHVGFSIPSEREPTPIEPKYIFVTCLVTGTQFGAMTQYLMDTYSLTLDEAQAYLRSLDRTCRNGSGYLNKPIHANAMVASSLYRFTYLLTYHEYERLSVAVMNDDSIKSFILGAVAMPVANGYKVVETGIYKVPFFCGGKRITESNDDTIYVQFSRTGSMSDYLLHKEGNFPWIVNSFLDLEPYHRCEMFIPFCGKVEIPSSVLLWGEETPFKLYYSVDLVSGECTAYLRFGYQWASEITMHGQMGVRLSFDSTNTRELENQMRSSAISASIGYLSSIINLGLGAISGNPLPVVAGVTGFAKTTANLVSTNLSMITRGNVSYDVQGSSFYDALEAHIIETWTSPIDQFATEAVNKYCKLYGKPYRHCDKLSTFSGFTIVSEIHLEDINAFKKEKDEIERLLKTGVIL